MGSSDAMACPAPPNHVVDVEAALTCRFKLRLQSSVVGQLCNKVRTSVDLIGVSDWKHMWVGEAAEDVGLHPGSAGRWRSK